MLNKKDRKQLADKILLISQELQEIATSLQNKYDLTPTAQTLFNRLGVLSAIEKKLKAEAFEQEERKKLIHIIK